FSLSLFKCPLPELAPPPHHAPGPAHRRVPGPSDTPAPWCTHDTARAWQECAPACPRRSRCPLSQWLDHKYRWGLAPYYGGSYCADPGWPRPDEIASCAGLAGAPVGYAARAAPAATVQLSGVRAHVRRRWHRRPSSISLPAPKSAPRRAPGPVSQAADRLANRVRSLTGTSR